MFNQFITHLLYLNKVANNLLKKRGKEDFKFYNRELDRLLNEKSTRGIGRGKIPAKAMIYLLGTGLGINNIPSTNL